MRIGTVSSKTSPLIVMRTDLVLTTRHSSS
jgi:hypothetical protein